MAVKEYTLTTNAFEQPKVLIENEAAYTLIIRLLLLEPGTNQTHPDMGIGIRSHYRFTAAEDLSKLTKDLKDQLSTYMPQLATTDIQIQAYGTTLAIFITTDENNMYGLGFQTETGEIKTLKLSDL